MEAETLVRPAPAYRGAAPQSRMVGEWEQEPAAVTAKVPHGTLWTRGLLMAETEIGAGDNPSFDGV